MAAPRTRAEFHEDEDLICPIGHSMPCSIDEVNDVWVPLQHSLESAVSTSSPAFESGLTHHNVHFLLHFAQHSFIGNGDPLEHMMCRSVDWLGRPYEVDMGKSTWNEMLGASLAVRVRLALR